METPKNIDVWIPLEKAHDLFGKITNNTVTFESGGAIWVPAQPDHHMLRGLKYSASGTAQQLQQLSAKLISQCLTGGHELDGSPDTEQWMYLNEQDTQFGPFTGKSLHKWTSKGIWTPDFPICHGQSGIWLPVWLVLQLLGLHSAAPPTTTAADPTATGQLAASKSMQAGAATHDAAADEYGSSASYQQSGQLRHDGRRHLKPRHTAGTHLQPLGSSHGNEFAVEDYGSNAGHRSLQPPGYTTTADGEIHRSPAGPAKPYRVPGHTSVATATAAAAPGHADDPDTDMADGFADVMAELQRLRQDSVYLQELNAAVDMDWEPVQEQQQQHQQQGALHQQDTSDMPATSLAAADNLKQVLQGQQMQHFAGSSSSSLLVVVIDTNVLLDSRGLVLLQLLQQQQQQLQLQQLQRRLLVVIPWTVLVELDKLKARHPKAGEGPMSVSSQARAALRFLHSAMAPDNSCRNMYKAQSIQEFRAAARDFDFGVSDKAIAADDRILQCALSYQQQLTQQQQQSGASAAQFGLLLLTNDVAFKLKAQANSIRVASLRDLPALYHNTHHHQQQQVLSQLEQLATGTPSPVVTSNSNGLQQSLQTASTAAPAPAGAAAAAAQESPHWQPTAAGKRQLHQLNAEGGSAESLALGHISSLRLGLAGEITAVFKAEYDDLWLDVVSSKPPWSDTDFLYVLYKHWRSTLQDHLQPAAKHNKKQLEVAVQYLINVNKQLHHRRGSSGSSSALPPDQLQQNVAVRVIQLLEGFGALAAAADVAAAAGLDWDRGPGLGSAGYAKRQGGAANGPCMQQQLAAAPAAGVVAGVGGILNGAAHVQDVEKSVGGQTQQQQQQQGIGSVDLANHILVQHAVSAGSNAVAVEAAAAAGVTSPRLRLHAIRHSQPHAAAAAAGTAASTNGVAVTERHIGHLQGFDGQPHQQQQQQQMLGQHLQQQGSFQYAQIPDCQQYLGQQQQQQGSHNLAIQQQPHHQQQQQRQQSDVMSWVSSACSAIPVPQLEGPCFRLHQLLDYTVVLVQAALPALQQIVLQQMQQGQPAVGLEEMQSLNQQLHQVVQTAEYAISLVVSFHHHQQQQQPPGIALQALPVLDNGILVSLSGPILQLGRQLVELCCWLLSDADACTAVSGQLSAHASEFVRDAVGYVVQQQAMYGSLQGVSQLKAALEQLQATL